VVKEFSVSEELDVVKATDCCLLLLGCWDFEEFARSTCKEDYEA
jgi:hypothetical protein